jgi:uncharacterized protein YcnI
VGTGAASGTVRRGIRPRPRRGATAALAVLGVSLAVAAPAFGHAVVSPPVVESAALQVFTLSVPTEKEGRLTTTVQLTVPPGFAIDSFAPARGWSRRVSTTGSGETAVVNRVTWSGGHTETDEDAVFQFNATATEARTYTFKVRQTYDDGSIVDWIGAESSDTPAPRISARATLGGDGGTSTVSILALITGTVGVVLGLFALVARRGDRPLT